MSANANPAVSQECLMSHENKRYHDKPSPKSKRHIDGVVIEVAISV
jgi:hypothetical protein